MQVTESRKKLIKAVLGLLAITVLSTGGMMYFEGHSAFDAVWMTVVSLSTTGYGDMVPITVGGRVFMLLILVGGLVIVSYCLGTIVNILLEGQLARLGKDVEMTKNINNLKDHIIVCGAGRVGSNVAEVLASQDAPHIIVDISESRVNDMKEEGHLALQGDATRDEILRAAGLQRASGIICALANDAFNVFVTLSARAINPDVKIVSRAVHSETVAKLQHAGADKIVSTDKMGGHRMALAILKPQALELFETILAPHKVEIQLEELLVEEKSNMVGQPISAFFEQKEGELIVVARIRGDDIKMNPGPHQVVAAKDVLVLIGSGEQLRVAQENAVSKC